MLGVYQLSWSLLHAAWTGVASAVIAVGNWLSDGVVFVGVKGIDGVSGVGDSIVSAAAFLLELVMSFFRGFGGLLFQGLQGLYDLVGVLGTERPIDLPDLA